MPWNRETGCPTHYFSLVVCHKPGNNLWLAVNETKRRGWWLPGGFVECNSEDHFAAALRETKEEAGMDVELKGILRVENGMKRHGARQRVIFYAEPLDAAQEPKNVPDQESEGAAWMSVRRLEEKRGVHPSEGGLRGEELLKWAKYIENGGKIFPITVLSSEDSPIPSGM